MKCWNRHRIDPISNTASSHWLARADYVHYFSTLCSVASVGGIKSGAFTPQKWAKAVNQGSPPLRRRDTVVKLLAPLIISVHVYG